MMPNMSQMLSNQRGKGKKFWHAVISLWAIDIESDIFHYDTVHRYNDKLSCLMLSFCCDA